MLNHCSFYVEFTSSIVFEIFLILLILLLQAGSSPNVQINDDLVNLAETVLYCINEPEVFKPQGLDGEILIDKSATYILSFQFFHFNMFKQEFKVVMASITLGYYLYLFIYFLWSSIIAD